MIWKHAPKHKFFSYRVLKAAANLAAVYFNEGANMYAATVSKMGIPPNQYSLTALHRMDQDRIVMAEKRKKESTKARRIELRRKKAMRAEEAKKKESTTYKAGGFGDDIDDEEPPAKRPRISGTKTSAAKKPVKAKKQAAPDEDEAGPSTAVVDARPTRRKTKKKQAAPDEDEAGS